MDILGILILFGIFAFIWFLPTLNVLFSRKTNRSEKLLWLLVVFFTSWLGWIFYLFLAPIEKLSNKNKTSPKTPLKVYEMIFIFSFAVFMIYKSIICYLMMGTLLLFYGIYSISSLSQINKSEIEYDEGIISFEEDEEGYKMLVLKGNSKYFALIILIIIGFILSAFSIIALWSNTNKF
ncbi:PLDc N-terminal domain-containing protein [Flavobacterium sp. ANB]|nr:PLDc N-terminal domain-containing protein [Flavobacterium sp. ANB]MTD69773.1 hypothetical protein [Flavobacterium sp. LC2016-13]